MSLSLSLSLYRGVSRPQAESLFLALSSSLPMYGVSLFNAYVRSTINTKSDHPVCLRPIRRGPVDQSLVSFYDLSSFPRFVVRGETSRSTSWVRVLSASTSTRTERWWENICGRSSSTKRTVVASLTLWLLNTDTDCCLQAENHQTALQERHVWAESGRKTGRCRLSLLHSWVLALEMTLSYNRCS